MNFKQKVVQNNWSVEESFWRCRDLVGGRVTCNNIEDVYRFSHILKENIDNYPIDVDPINIQNYIDEPLQSGYRAIHVNFRLNVNNNLNKQYVYVPCEVQVRSLLQHAWGELTHQDIYKSQEIPEDLRARAKDIAEMLTAVDRIASDIRSRAMQEVSTSTRPPSLKNVSKKSLSWCFIDAFGRNPYDYIIEQAHNICDLLNIRSLENFSEKLKNINFQQRLNDLYRNIWGVNINISNEDIFLTSLYSFGSNDKKAIRWMSNKNRRELERIEKEIRQKMLFSLPESIEDFIEYIDTPSIDANDNIEIWADALGAIDECVCRVDIVNVDIFAENILKSYDIFEKKKDEDWEDYYQSIQFTLIHSGVETGDFDNPFLCARCAAKMKKDD